MTSSIDSLTRLTPVSLFNKEFAASKGLARYHPFSTPAPFTARSIFYLNALQLDHFIPSNIALLLKNNLHDPSFTQSTLQNILYNLKQQDRIGQSCFTFLNDKINRNQIEKVCAYLYTIMLYGQLVQSHNSAQSDTFAFESISSYSDKLVAKEEDTFLKEKLSLEKRQHISFLRSWLIELSVYSTDSSFQNEIDTLYYALINDSVQLKPPLLHLLQRIQQITSPLESICFQELFETVNRFPEEKVLSQLYFQIKTEQYYKDCLGRVRNLKQALARTDPTALADLAEKIKRAYNGCVFLLSDNKKIPCYCPTRFSAAIGKMRTEWQEINALFNRASGQFPHIFCSCQSQAPPTEQNLAQWPFRTNTLIPLTAVPPQTLTQLSQQHISHPFQNNQQKTLAVIGCNWGGGHREVTRGLANAAVKWGYHPFTVDLPKVLVSQDYVHNLFITRWLKKNWTISSLFNGLLSCKGYAIINFLRFIQSKVTPSGEEKKVSLILQHLLKINPSAVVTTYSSDNEAIIKASKILGIPCIHVATDIDYTIETRTKPVNYDHFYMALPFGNEECVNRIQNTTTPAQRIITGPPVRPEFTQPRTQEDVRQLKLKWGIDITKKVVVVTSGKNGSPSPFPELLAKRYATHGIDDIPIHLIVLTGEDNTQFRLHLETDISRKTPLSMTIRPSVSPEDMEELMAMAAYGGILIGKAGGTTLFEAISRGTRLLCDSIKPGLFSNGYIHFFVSIAERILGLFGFANQMRWEKINADFGTQFGFVETVSQVNEFFPKFDKMLANDNRPLIAPNLEVRNNYEEMNGLIRNAIEKAESDFQSYKSREEHRQL